MGLHRGGGSVVFFPDFPRIPVAEIVARRSPCGHVIAVAGGSLTLVRKCWSPRKIHLRRRANRRTDRDSGRLGENSRHLPFALQKRRPSQDGRCLLA